MTAEKTTCEPTLLLDQQADYLISMAARVRAGQPAVMTAAERAMLEAMPHRHTHRGPFEPVPLPGRLLAGLQHDAVAEGATLALADQHAQAKLVAIVSPASRARDLDQVNRAEVRRWTRQTTDTARDGIPAHAFAGRRADEAGRLRQRDFDLGRGLGLLADGGSPPPATAVLLTPPRRPDRLAPGRPGAASPAAACGQPVGFRRPVHPAARGGGHQDADQDQPGPAGIAAGAVAARRGPGHSGHGPPTGGRIARALTCAATGPARPGTHQRTRRTRDTEITQVS
jgi:hypothetical protein